MMDYLDYLPDTPYEQLPDSVKQTIGESDYQAKRLLARQLLVSSDAGASLPETLRQAYAVKQKNKAAEPVASGAAIHQFSGRNFRFAFRWSAAACVLLAATTITLLLRQPKERLIYQIVSAEVPPPTVIHDTVYQQRVVEKMVYRIQVDTVTRYVPEAPQLVYLTDTIYLEQQKGSAITFVKSKTAADEVRLLELLVPTK